MADIKDGPVPRTRRLVAGDGTSTVVRLNLRRVRLGDLYHWLLTTPRLSFAALMIGAYLGSNMLFALAYLACGGIENAHPGSFADAFFFSVQTMATIGYGKMVPVGLAANLLVTVEAGVGLFGVAVAAALMFSRFTRATAGVMFSRNMVVNEIDGVPTLMFRLANERRDLINEARVHVVMMQQERTAEGQSYSRLHDIELLRSFTPSFNLSWTVMHRIDEKSPLFGRGGHDLDACQAEFLVTVAGHHEGFQQQVHARKAYGAADIVWDMRFADIFSQLPDGRRALDYSRFHDLMPVAGGTAENSPPVSPPPP